MWRRTEGLMKQAEEVIARERGVAGEIVQPQRRGVERVQVVARTAQSPEDVVVEQPRRHAPSSPWMGTAVKAGRRARCRPSHAHRPLRLAWLSIGGIFVA